MKNLLIIALILGLACPVYAAKRMVTPEICANNIDDDHNGTADDGCPFSSVFTSVGGGIAADMADARRAGTITTATSTESSSGTFLKNTGNYRNGQWALNGNHSGTVYPWVKVRVPTTGNTSDNRVWLATAPFTASSQNSALTIVSNVNLPPPPSFGWVKLSGSFTFSGDFILYGLNTSRVEIDCMALVTSSSSVQTTANPQCPSGAPVSGIAFDAAGTPASAAATSSLQVPITIGAGSNRHLRCGVAHSTETNTITGVSSSVDGAFTLFNWVGENGWYYLNGPTTGAHTITATFSQAQNASMGCDSWSGVHQTAPYGAVQTGTGTGTPTIQLAGAGDQIALDHLTLSQEPVDTVTVGDGQTQRWQKNITGVTNADGRTSVSSSKQGDSSVTMTMTMADLKAWTYQAAMLRPPSGAGSAPTLGSPSVTSLGSTTATVEATVDDASATCDAEYDTDTGAPYANNTADVGASGGKCVVQITGLAASTPYFYRIRATNSVGTTNGAQGTFDTTTATAVTQLGITSAEITIWQARKNSGPYRIPGDVSSNSPGDWTNIVSRAQTFAADPYMDNWQGQTAAGQWQPDAHLCSHTQGSSATDACVPSFSQGIHFVSAAFATLVDPANHNYASHIRTALLAQIAYPGTTFLDTNKWPDEQIGDAYSYMIAYWLTRLIYAYDMVRSNAVFSAGERLSIDTWFSNAAYYWAKNTHYLISNNAFPSRNTQYATSVDVGVAYPTDLVISNGWGPQGENVVYYNCATSARGRLAGWSHDLWNNRSSSQILFAALGAHINGTLTNDAQTKTWAKMWFKEWLTYAMFPDGTFNDWKRWTDGTPPDSGTNQGWVYGAIVLGSMSSLADVFARHGDPSLYTFSTSAGRTFGATNPAGYSGDTAGGPKSLLKGMQTHSLLVTQYGLASPNWIAADDGTNCANSAYRIQPNAAGNPSVHENHYLQGNIYYKDAAITSRYMRTATGSPPYPADPTSNSNPWGGVSGAYAGILFMYGQLENVIWPYP